MRFAPIALAGALVIALVSPVAAQGTTTSGMFVGGLGGLTFGTATSSAIGGQVGVRIMPNLFVIGEIGRIQDVLPGEIADQLEEFEELAEEAGFPGGIEVKVPALYGFGGVRWAQAGRRVAPFVEGGVGFAHLTGEIKIGGVDIIDLIGEDIGDLPTSSNEFLIAFGSGVNIGLTPTISADAGYRFTRIFTDFTGILGDNPVPNTSMIYGAIKILFGR